MGDVTREEVEKALDAFSMATIGSHVGYGYDDEEGTRAALLSLFDAAIRQAREGAERERDEWAAQCDEMGKALRSKS